MALPRNGFVQPVEGVAGGTPISAGVTNRSTFATGLKNVTTAGTGVQLGSQAIPDGFSVLIRARSANTGIIYVGNSKANAENHAVATQLASGEFLTLFITNTDLVWIDAGTNGEGVTWAVET